MFSPSRRGQDPSSHHKPPLPPGGAALEDVGRSLRRAREAKGLEAKDLSDRLRIGVEQLIALENGDRDRLPEAVFVLAQARRVAEALQINLDAELRALRSSGELDLPAKGAEADANPAAEQPSGDSELPAGKAAAGWRPLTLLVSTALLLAGGGALWLLHPFGLPPFRLPLGGSAQGERPQPPAAASVASNPPSGPATPAAPTSPRPAPLSTGAGGASRLPPGVAVPNNSRPLATAIGTRPLPATPLAPGNAIAKPAAAANLVITAKGPSWLEVRDSNGHVLYRGLFAAEQSFPLGKGLRVLAGRPDLVSTRLGADPPRPLGRISDVRWQSFASRP